MVTSYNIDDITASMAKSGYAVIKNFLNTTELNLALEDCKKTPPNIRIEDGSGTVTMFHGSGSPVVNKVFYKKALELSKQIDPRMDTVAGNGMYFSEQTFAYCNWDWHLDHDVFYRWQQLHSYYNFFITIIKEDPKLSGLSIIPLDVIKKEFPQYSDRLYNNGACRFYPKGNITTVYDDEIDEIFELPVNIENIKISPEIGPGDLLLLKGCVIHHAQDTLTHRVALSMRVVQGSYILSRKKLDSGGLWKKHVIKSTPELSKMYEVFDALNKEEITSVEYTEYLKLN